MSKGLKRPKKTSYTLSKDPKRPKKMSPSSKALERLTKITLAKQKTLSAIQNQPKDTLVPFQ